MPYVKPLDRDFVLARVQVDDNGCWLWTMSLDREGYSLIGPGAQERRAHRLAYRLWIGGIPEDMTVDHICWVRHCVNPQHLQLLTPGENTLRRSDREYVKPDRSDQRRQDDRTHCIRGHEWVPENLKPGRRGRPQCRLCANECRRAQRARRKEADLGT